MIDFVLASGPDIEQTRVLFSVFFAIPAVLCVVGVIKNHRAEPDEETATEAMKNSKFFHEFDAWQLERKPGYGWLVWGVALNIFFGLAGVMYLWNQVTGCNVQL